MEEPKTSSIWETSDHRAKRSEIWVSGGTSRTYMEYVYYVSHCSVPGHYIRFTCDFSDKTILKSTTSTVMSILQPHFLYVFPVRVTAKVTSCHVEIFQMYCL